MPDTQPNNLLTTSIHPKKGKTMKKPDTQPARTRIRISGERGRITRMTISGRSVPAQNKTPQTAQ